MFEKSSKCTNEIRKNTCIRKKIQLVYLYLVSYFLIRVLNSTLIARFVKALVILLVFKGKRCLV